MKILILKNKTYNRMKLRDGNYRRVVIDLDHYKDKLNKETKKLNKEKQGRRDENKELKKKVNQLTHDINVLKKEAKTNWEVMTKK